MIKKYSIKTLLKHNTNFINQQVLVEGWIRSLRYSIFISLNDGSTVDSLQIIVPKNLNKKILKKITLGSSIKVIGIIQKSIGKKQIIELKCKNIIIYNSVKTINIQKSILQPKEHSTTIIRKQAHLRFQTSYFSCIMRIRHYASFLIHKFFNDKNFYYIHTPIITTSNCEGTGKMFQVTTLNFSKIDYNPINDFFKRETYLSVSGQLEAEAAIIGLGKVYTFGPVFRAENSNTSKHLSEFWMVEPEIAFFSLCEIIKFAEVLLKYIINNILKHCLEDILFLNKKLKKFNENKKDFLIKRLQNLLCNKFQKISYTKAINILVEEEKNNNIKFYDSVYWGIDLKSEHEQYLIKYFENNPIIIFNYPTDIKPFYMKVNEDTKTVKAMDILLPKIGEIIGGSQREEDYDKLLYRMNETNTNKKQLWWYLETRKFGSIPHSGFGLGFDRLVQFITGVNNIRDVIPFPRTPKNAEF